MTPPAKRKHSHAVAPMFGEFRVIVDVYLKNRRVRHSTVDEA
jgi:hypothetical protein